MVTATTAQKSRPAQTILDSSADRLLLCCTRETIASHSDCACAALLPSLICLSNFSASLSRLLRRDLPRVSSSLLACAPLLSVS